jgi:hypothetical protein
VAPAVPVAMVPKASLLVMAFFGILFFIFVTSFVA